MRATADTPVDARGRRAMAGLLLAALLIVAWLAHRSLVASETGAAYTQFEDAFPLADGWLALCLVAASYCVVTARRAAMFWVWPGAAPGSASSAWTCPTTCNTAIWGKGGNGVTELVINLLTLGLGPSRQPAFMMNQYAL